MNEVNKKDLESPLESLEIFGIEELEVRQEMALLTLFAPEGKHAEDSGNNSVKGCAMFGFVSKLMNS